MDMTSSRMRFLTLVLPILFVAVGCGGGIKLRPGDIAMGADLPGSPSGPVVSVAAGAGGSLLTSDRLVVFVRTSATSFQGNLEGEGIRVADPIMESGIELVFNEVNK